MTGKFTFSREERLRYNKHIDRLFSGGKSFVMPPLKVFYLDSGEPEDQPCRVLISVPRRKFKKAVDRNRLRRLIREAYRMNSHRLMEHQVHMHIAIVYIGNTADIIYRDIEGRMSACLERLVKEVTGDG